jgi:hypothetical protein
MARRREYEQDPQMELDIISHVGGTGQQEDPGGRTQREHEVGGQFQKASGINLIESPRQVKSRAIGPPQDKVCARLAAALRSKHGASIHLGGRSCNALARNLCSQ